jgi:hypothetical protein
MSRRIWEGFLEFVLFTKECVGRDSSALIHVSQLGEKLANAKNPMRRSLSRYAKQAVGRNKHLTIWTWQGVTQSYPTRTGLRCRNIPKDSLLMSSWPLIVSYSCLLFGLLVVCLRDGQ